MKYIYHHTLAPEFKNSLNSLIGSKLLLISGERSNIYIPKFGSTEGILNSKICRIYFEKSENDFVSLLLSTENYETMTGEDVDFFSECHAINKFDAIPDNDSTIELPLNFLIESIEVYGKKRFGKYPLVHPEKGEFDFDILTESFIIFKDRVKNYFYISSNGTHSLGFGYCGADLPSHLTQKYIDEEEYILKKQFTIRG